MVTSVGRNGVDQRCDDHDPGKEAFVGCEVGVFARRASRLAPCPFVEREASPMFRRTSLPTYRRPALGVTLAAVLSLAACGVSDSPNQVAAQAQGTSAAPSVPAANADFNTADVTFAQHMIEHHKQAVEMAQMALDMSANPKVKALAQAINDAQSPEITTLTGWLTAWGQQVAMPAHPHAPDALPSGMMTGPQMAGLHKAKGKTFDTLFLKEMIAHHQGAINLSNTEHKDGKSTDAVSLAAKIAKDQKAQVSTMKHLGA